MPCIRPCFFFHMVSFFYSSFSFDNIFLARAILVNGTDFKISYTHNDVVHKLPLIQKSPQILLKDVNSPMTITFRFNCPNKASCRACSLSNDEKRKLKESKATIPTCDFTRKIRLIDSYCHLGFSLAHLITDLHDVASKTNTPLQQLFKNTYHFAEASNYNETQFRLMTEAKIRIPFNLCTSVEAMKNIKSPPQQNEFEDVLSGSISSADYHHFTTVWTSLQIDNMLSLVWLYGILDVVSTFINQVSVGFFWLPYSLLFF